MNADLRAHVEVVRRRRANSEWVTQDDVDSLIAALDAVEAERARLAALLDEVAFAGLPDFGEHR